MGSLAFQLEVENVGGGILEVNLTGPDWVDIIPHQVSRMVAMSIHTNTQSKHTDVRLPS
jgi:hypothetical protein